MYKCEKCHQKVPATKQYKIERPPQVLCVQLKRFNMMGGKNGTPVTLARNLNISNHVRWANQIPVEYKLVSMINHVGSSANCGHYTSIAEGADGKFYSFDDAIVIPTTLQNALNGKSAYVIFYEMKQETRNQILSEGKKTKPDKLNTSPRTKQRATVIVENKAIPIPKEISQNSPISLVESSSCCHKMHVFKDLHIKENCTKTEVLLQLRLTLNSVFPDGKPRPRHFASLLLQSWKEHFPDTTETTRSIAQKLSAYDRRQNEKEIVSSSGKINWTTDMIQNVRETRNEAFEMMMKEVDDEKRRPASLSSYWREAWYKLYPDIDFRRVVSRLGKQAQQDSLVHLQLKYYGELGID